MKYRFCKGYVNCTTVLCVFFCTRVSQTPKLLHCPQSSTQTWCDISKCVLSVQRLLGSLQTKSPPCFPSLGFHQCKCLTHTVYNEVQKSETTI